MSYLFAFIDQMVCQLQGWHSPTYFNIQMISRASSRYLRPLAWGQSLNWNASQHLEFPRSLYKLRNTDAIDRLAVKTSRKANIPPSIKPETFIVSSSLIFHSSLSAFCYWQAVDTQPASPVEGWFCFHALNDVRFAWKRSCKNNEVLQMPEDCTDLFLWPWHPSTS